MMNEELPADKEKSMKGFLAMSKIGNVLTEMGIDSPGYLESSTQYDDMDSKDLSSNSSIGTQVDIRSLVSESEMTKEESPEIFWQKMAEQSKAALEEARDENKKLHITIDFLARENVRYQQIIDEQEDTATVSGYNENMYPPLPDEPLGEAATALYYEYKNSENSFSL